ncbi:MFS transporter [Cellulophaga sp. BC115SP]|uniref:MFS transporter n=1 Tax=Cellulophaga sp. BC115SP TaxID=2683263 RepID=UPI0014126A7A|nr:MFS transporter [Cellulophaga sp. BC115SP]NBB28595.1 MFS transporter [Cellulophaga sp. BC115SP]
MQSTIHTTKVKLAFTLCMLSYLLGGCISTMMSSYLPVALPDLLNRLLNEQKLSEYGAYINAIFLYGWMCGGLSMGFTSDKIGRIPSLSIVTALCGLGTVFIVFVKDWYVLLALRFISGVGVGGILLLTTVYISEIWPEKNRPVILGILAVSFPLGIVLSGGITILFPYWHQAFWIGLIPIGIAILMFVFLPESPEWQKSQGKAKSTTPIESIDYHKNLWTGILIFGAVLIGLWGIFSWLPTWVQGLLSNGQKGQQERGIVMMLLGVGGIIGGTLSGFLIKSFGFKKTLLATFLGCSSVCMLLFLTNHTFSGLVYIETALLSLFFGISQGALSSFIPALFPAQVRGFATGLCFNIGRFFTATAVFFVGSLVSVLGGLGQSLMTFSLAFVLAFIMLLRTKSLVSDSKIL